MSNLKFFSVSSPVRYLGTNLTLLLLALIYLLFTLLPFRTETEYIILSYTAIILFIGAMSCAFSLVFLNPGFLKASVASDQIQKVCEHCEANQLERASHCYSCDVCVEIRDHHCKFLGMCIGKQNYPCYFSLLTCTTFLSITIAIHTFFMGYRAHFQVIPSVTFWINIFLFVMFSMLTFGVGTLWVFHIYLCVTGLTTKEYFNSNPNSKMISNIYAGMRDEHNQSTRNQDQNNSLVQIRPNEPNGTELTKEAAESLKTALKILKQLLPAEVEERRHPQPAQIHIQQADSQNQLNRINQHDPSAQQRIEGQLIKQNPVQIVEATPVIGNPLQTVEVIQVLENDETATKQAAEENQWNSKQNQMKPTQSNIRTPMKEMLSSSQLLKSQAIKMEIVATRQIQIRSNSKTDKQNERK